MDNEKCREIMTHNPECCEADDTVIVAVDIMKDMNCGSIPIVDAHSSKRLVGIVTDRDICLHVVGSDLVPSSVAVRDCMTSSPISCHEDDSIEAAIDLMERNQIRRIVIVDDDNRVKGIVSQADIAVKSKEEPLKIFELLEEISEPAMSGR